MELCDVLENCDVLEKNAARFPSNRLLSVLGFILINVNYSYVLENDLHLKCFGQEG